RDRKFYFRSTTPRLERRNPTVRVSDWYFQKNLLLGSCRHVGWRTIIFVSLQMPRIMKSKAATHLTKMSTYFLTLRTCIFVARTCSSKRTILMAARKPYFERPRTISIGKPYIG